MRAAPQNIIAFSIDKFPGPAGFEQKPQRPGFLFHQGAQVLRARPKALRKALSYKKQAGK
jgi:hypothetical protein